jgi:hypothetical protein
MTIPSYRSSEPLYIIMVKAANAERMLKEWAQKSRASASIEGNRMRLFEQRSLDRFHLDWPHSWDGVVIWDCWNRRHMYLD